MSLKSVFHRLHIKLLLHSSNESRIKYLRSQGMKIGKDCFLLTMAFGTEPYLIELGDHVAIADGTEFLTHDGAIWSFRDELPDADLFGRIKIGSNVIIGINCTIMPNTVIGNNCIIGAGSIVRGNFPDDSVIIGNPAKVFMKRSMQRFLYLQNPGLLMTKNLNPADKVRTIKKHFGISL